MEHILLIHIGMRKTGTTALQCFLYENMHVLEKHGWCYPNLKKEMTGIRHVVQQKEINGDVFYQEMGQLDTDAFTWNRAWEHVTGYLKDKNVIISNEVISVWDTKDFIKEAKKKYHNIKIVIYLRRQDRAIESLWNQEIKKVSGCFQTFREFLCSNDDGKVTNFYYKKQLDEVSEIIGEKNLIVRVYEKEQLCGEFHTMESDFLSVLGIKPDWHEWKRCSPQNIGLSDNYLEIKRIFNSIQLIDGVNMTQRHYKEWFETLSVVFSKQEETKGCFTLEERKEFLKQFDKENREIAKEYLHRKDGILFYEDIVDLPLYESSCSSFEEDLIRVLSLFILKQNDELQRIKNDFLFLTKRVMLKNNSGSKKIILFGAGKNCRKLLSQLKISAALIADNDEKKSGQKVEGIKIYNAKKIKNWTDYFIIVTCRETAEIEAQIQEQGAKKEVDYILAKDYLP